MIVGAPSWMRQFIRAGEDGVVSVNLTPNELVPVLLDSCFSYPVLKGFIIVDGDFRYDAKEEAKVLHNVVLDCKK